MTISNNTITIYILSPYLYPCPLTQNDLADDSEKP